jgi:DNA-binding IclR family transcriptional regulator
MNSNVKSAERVLDILELFSLRDETLALRDVADGLGIPKSSASMLLRTLEARGYLQRERDGFRLEPILRDANSGWVGGASSLLTRVATPVMRELVDTFRETTTLGVLTGEYNVRVVRSIISPQVVRYELNDTEDLPAYCTGLGQVNLAFSPPELVERYLSQAVMEPRADKTITTPEALQGRLVEIRRQGYSVHIEERIVGASGAAAPVFGPGGKIAAAINMATVTFRFMQTRDQIIAAVLDGAARITRQLGGEPPEGSVFLRNFREPRVGKVV